MHYNYFHDVSIVYISHICTIVYIITGEYCIVLYAKLVIKVRLSNLYAHNIQFRFYDEIFGKINSTIGNKQVLDQSWNAQKRVKPLVHLIYLSSDKVVVVLGHLWREKYLSFMNPILQTINVCMTLEWY